MRIFIDTTNIDEITKENARGVFEGITTNPSLVVKERIGFIDVIQIIRDRVFIFNKSQSLTERIVVGGSHSRYVIEAVKTCVDMATIPFNAMKKMLSHLSFETGLEKFQSGWKIGSKTSSFFSIESIRKQNLI